MSICINQNPYNAFAKQGGKTPVLPSLRTAFLHSFALFPLFSVIFRLTVSAPVMLIKPPSMFTLCDKRLIPCIETRTMRIYNIPEKTLNPTPLYKRYGG